MLFSGNPRSFVRRSLSHHCSLGVLLVAYGPLAFVPPLAPDPTHACASSTTMSRTVPAVCMQLAEDDIVSSGDNAMLSWRVARRCACVRVVPFTAMSTCAHGTHREQSAGGSHGAPRGSRGRCSARLAASRCLLLVLCVGARLDCEAAAPQRGRWRIPPLPPEYGSSCQATAHES